MNDLIANILKEDINLYCNYAIAEANYILSLGKEFALVDIDLDIDDETFNRIIKELAANGMCLDQFLVEILKKQISELENKNEKTSKHTRNKKNRKN